MDYIMFAIFETEIRENSFIRDEAYWTLHQCVMKTGEVYTVRMLKMELFKQSVVDILVAKFFQMSDMEGEYFERFAGWFFERNCKTHNGKGSNKTCAYARPKIPYLGHQRDCSPIIEKIIIASEATPPMRSLASLLHVTGHAQLYLSWNQRIKIGYQISKALNDIHAHNDRVTIVSCYDKTTCIYGYGDLSSMNILVDDRGDAKLSLDPAICYAIERSVCDYYGEDPRDRDVYRLGIILLELVSGKEVNVRQVEVFLSKTISKLTCLLDPKLILSEASHLDLVLTLAVRCVYGLPDRRPSIKEILEHMERIYQSILNTAALSTLNL